MEAIVEAACIEEADSGGPQAVDTGGLRVAERTLAAHMALGEACSL